MKEGKTVKAVKAWAFSHRVVQSKRCGIPARVDLVIHEIAPIPAKPRTPRKGKR